MTRALLFALLAIVATAAAILSFDALRGLALLSDFTPSLAWLLPVVVDAGAAAGTSVWLTRATGRPHTFGRALALVLLASSVGGNAVSHGLSAYGLRPPWWLVVVVSAIAPAVLGAVVHLAVLVGRAPTRERAEPVSPADRDDAGEERDDAGDRAGEPGDDRAAELIAAGAGRRRLARELEISEYEARRLLGGAGRNGDGETDD